MAPGDKPTTTKKKNKKSAGGRAPVERLREFCLALPDTSETPNHGHASFAVGKKTFLMYLDNHHGDGRVAIWARGALEDQSAMVDSDPESFFVPPYVGHKGWVGVRLDRKVEWRVIESVVMAAYRSAAPRRTLAKLDAAR